MKQNYYGVDLTTKEPERLILLNLRIEKLNKMWWSKHSDNKKCKNDSSLVNMMKIEYLIEINHSEKDNILWCKYI